LSEAAAHLYLLIATYVLNSPIHFGADTAPGARRDDALRTDHRHSARKQLIALGELELVEGGQGRPDGRKTI
jgi:hypothetical protein